jgi:glycerol-3-phosphate acyltransferase PlsY
MKERILSLLIGYILGSVLTAEIIVRGKTGRPASEFGSGNPGMANVMRVFGFRTGIAVLAGDLLKTVAASLLSCLLFPSQGQILVLYAGLGAVIGHNWPLWNRLKGGKGVAVSCMAIFLFSPLWGLIADAAGMLVVLITGYLPLGAVVITTLYAVFAILFFGREAAVLSVILALIMFQRHYPGLVRVMRGEERRNAQLFNRNKAGKL